MKWSLAIVALSVLVVAAVSRRLSGTPVTAAMVFVASGVLANHPIWMIQTIHPPGRLARAMAATSYAGRSVVAS